MAERLGSLAGELSTLISRESGLSLKDTSHEVARAVDVFRFAAIEALRDDGEAFAGDVSPNGRARRAHTLRLPVGLVAAITPFNHPLNQVAHKVAPAIAAGAPIVLKPSERTPLSAIRLGELLVDEGLPPAAAQIVCGEPAAILDEFLAHEAVEVVSFTGGVAVGKSIASAARLPARGARARRERPDARARRRRPRRGRRACGRRRLPELRAALHRRQADHRRGRRRRRARRADRRADAPAAVRRSARSGYRRRDRDR